MGAPLRVIGVRHGVDDCLSHCDWRQVPSFCPARRIDGEPVNRMFLDKCNSVDDGCGQIRPDLSVIEEMRLVGAPESSDLDPGIRKVVSSVFAKEKEAADGKHLPPLMGGDES